MDTILTVPLFGLAVGQGILVICELLPKPISVRCCQFLKGVLKNSVAKTMGYTLTAIMIGLCVLSSLQIAKFSPYLESDTVALIDHLRAQVTFILSSINIFLFYASTVICDLVCQLESSTVNLAVLKKQALGLQAEYKRATTKEENVGNFDESAALKKQVDKLIQELTSAQVAVDEANAERQSAEIRVSAMQEQFKGFDREFNRLLEENKRLTTAPNYGEAKSSATGFSLKKEE